MNSKQLVGSILDTTLRIVFIVAAAMFIFKYATVAYDFGYRVFAEEPVSSDENARTISISITEEASAKDIGKALEEKGLIQDAGLFYIQELLSGNHGKINPGIYELNSAMTAEEMMAVMAAVPAVDENGAPLESAEDSEEGEAAAGEAEALQNDAGDADGGGE